ncbi:MAG: hypothetical protein JRI47_09285 [Deltaproteobacteria bacterium]|nr:hypothetical protein [Deltaproteobacteria bacterium]
MKRFEYEITHHTGDEFETVVYFCSETGECAINKVPGDQSGALVRVLNERGQEGWELVQMSFGKDGLMAFWKRKVKDKKTD